MSFTKRRHSIVTHKKQRQYDHILIICHTTGQTELSQSGSGKGLQTRPTAFRWMGTETDIGPVDRRRPATRLNTCTAGTWIIYEFGWRECPGRAGARQTKKTSVFTTCSDMQWLSFNGRRQRFVGCNKPMGRSCATVGVAHAPWSTCASRTRSTSHKRDLRSLPQQNFEKQIVY